jgi:peptidoglycan-associated lipoprotein
MNVMTHRRSLALLGIVALALIPLATPAYAFSACGSAGRTNGFAQLPGGQPLADPIPHIPINGTAGFAVPGANTLGGGDLLIGLGYLGQDSVCQQQNGIFDQNTLFLQLGYGITDRIQLSLQVPYTWYEADKSDFSGDGVDDISFGLGYRFLDEAGWRPALSVLGYGVAPTAERKEGLGTNEWGFGAALTASKTIVGPLSAFASAGYQYNGRGAAKVEDQFISGLGLEYVITPHVSIVTEGTANTNWRAEDDRHSDWIAGMSAGVRLRFGNFIISLAGRKGFTSDAPDWGAFALVSYQMNVGTPFGAKKGAAAGEAGAPGAGGAGGAGAPGAGAGGPGTGVAAIPSAALPPSLRSALKDINFEFDQYGLTSEAKTTLDDLAQALKGNPQFAVTIEGHADERGTVEYNMALGEQRAQAAKAYLVSLGIDASRVDTTSFGEQQPVDTGHDELAWAINRRAHFQVRGR